MKSIQKTITYEELQGHLLANQVNPLRNHTEEERKALIQSLLQDGRVTDPITIYKPSAQCKGEILDGFHRLEVLPEVFKLDPTFSKDIPVICKQEKVDKELYAMVRQMGRRQLTAEDWRSYAAKLIEKGHKESKVVKHIAEVQGVSTKTVKRQLNPEKAQSERDRRKEREQKQPSTYKEKLHNASEIEDKVERRQELNKIHQEQRIIKNKKSITTKKESVIDFKKIDCIQDAIKTQQELMNRFRTEGLDTLIFSNSIDKLNKLLTKLQNECI